MNDIPSKADDVVATNGITADQVPTLGDQGIIFILNKKSDNRFKDATNSDYGTVGRGGIAFSFFVDPKTNKWVPTVFPVYAGSQYVLNTYGAFARKSSTSPMSSVYQ